MNNLNLHILAELYLTGNDLTNELPGTAVQSLWDRLMEHLAERLPRENGVRVTFVEGQPFEGDGAAEAMFDYIDATGHLPISTDFNGGGITRSERHNLLFRVVHDMCHWLCDHEHRHEGRRCNFALEGETRAARKQTEIMLATVSSAPRQMRELLAQLVFSEVVLQGAVFYHTGDFADQRAVLVPMSVINGWYTQNGLPPVG